MPNVPWTVDSRAATIRSLRTRVTLAYLSSAVKGMKYLELGKAQSR